MNDEKEKQRRRGMFNGYVKIRDKARLAQDSLVLLSLDKDVLGFTTAECDVLCAMLGRALLKEGEMIEMVEQAKDSWELDE